MYVPGADISYGVRFKANISLARGSNIGKPTTTEELASRGTLYDGENIVAHSTNTQPNNGAYELHSLEIHEPYEQKSFHELKSFNESRN